jgi:hypothetical protein
MLKWVISLLRVLFFGYKHSFGYDRRRYHYSFSNIWGENQITQTLEISQENGIDVDAIIDGAYSGKILNHK